MGASGWLYFVPWREDVAEALALLRASVFERGEYVDPDDAPRQLLASGAAERLPANVQADLRRRASRPPPRTIDELVMRAREQGTHSVLDMMSVSSKSELLVVAPLSTSQLHTLFWSVRPTRLAMEREHNHLMNVRPPWHGTYVEVYDEEKAVELCFAGFSGR